MTDIIIKPNVATKADIRTTDTPIANKVVAADVNELVRASDDTIDYVQEIYDILTNQAKAQALFFEASNVVAVTNTTDYFLIDFAGTTLVGESAQFTRAGSRLTYTGPRARVFAIRGLLVCTAGNNQTIHGAAFVNDSITQGRGEGITGSGGRSSNIIIEIIARLETGDVVDLRVRNLSGTDNITVRNFNLAVEPVGSVEFINGGA